MSLDTLIKLTWKHW